MKTRWTLVTLSPLVLLTGLSMAAHAQDLFRTARPSYTREIRPNSSLQPHASWTRSAPKPAKRLTNRPYREERLDAFADVRAVSSDDDYQRLVSAWENYRREVIRYRARKGDFSSHQDARVPLRQVAERSSDFPYLDPIRDGRREAGQLPVSAELTGAPCRFRHRNASALDTPADRRPTLDPDVRPSAYEEPPRWNDADGFAPVDRRPRLERPRRLEPLPYPSSQRNSLRSAPAAELPAPRGRYINPARTASRSSTNFFSTLVRD